MALKLDNLTKEKTMGAHLKSVLKSSLRSKLHITILVLVLSVSTLKAEVNTKDGGGSTGGGNSVGSSMIEQYVIDVRSLPGFKTEAQPIFDRLEQKFPNLGKVLNASLDEITWYFIPATINNVPRSETGLPLLESTQVAAQNTSTSEVFIDKVAYGKLSDKAKGALILHEVLMNLHCISNCNSDSHARIRKLVIAILKEPSLSSEKIYDHLFSFLYFSARLRTSYNSGITRLLFSQTEESLYQTAYPDWFKVIQDSCANLPPAYSDKDSTGSFMSQAMRAADINYRSQEFCNQNEKVCKGIPSLSFSSSFSGIISNDVFRAFKCPIN